MDSGVQGLQTVVLYSLPELDGAIETMVLGGLVGGDRIIVIPERIRKLSSRLQAWTHLRKSDVRSRKLAILVYGFPPNIGAIGTAALLNVGNSLRNLFQELSLQGYNVNNFGSDPLDGEKLITALKIIMQDSVYAGGGQLEDKINRAQLLVDKVMTTDAISGMFVCNKKLINGSTKDQIKKRLLLRTLKLFHKRILQTTDKIMYIKIRLRLMSDYKKWTIIS
jgi:magnesium chelatase subunit H